jgi:hypothetical protein
VTRRALAVALTALLLVGALPAAGGHAAAPNLNVAGQQTTDSDFGAGQTTNVSVVGSGESASVVLDQGSSGTVLSSFESGDLSGYGGDTGSFNVQTTTVFDGTYAAESDGASQAVISDTGVTTQQGNTYSARVRPTGASDFIGMMFGTQNEKGNSGISGYLVDIQSGNQLRIFSVGGGSFGSIADTSVGSFSTDQWITIEVDWYENNTIEADAYAADGTHLAGVQGTNSDYTSGGVGWRHGSGNTAQFDHFVNESGGTTAVPTGQFISENVSASRLQSLAVNRTLDNASMTVEAQRWTGSQWAVAQSATYTGSGNSTLDISAASADTWRANVTFEAQSGTTTAELHDLTWLFDSQQPTIDEAAASPQGGQQLQSSSVSLSAPLNDSDFGAQQGDSLNVTWWVDGDDVHSETVTSNGTVSYQHSATMGGSHEWALTASSTEYDEADTTSQNLSYQVPATVRVYNETNATQLIDGVDVTATFFSGDTVIRNQTSNGVINFGGLDASKSYVLELDAAGYHERTVFIRDLYTQQRAYLLNQTTANSLETRFTLNDLTGQFDSDSRLYIAKPINQTSNSSYQVIAGGEFGVEGFTVDLQANERYRLTLENDNGDRRVLGSYTAITAQEVELDVGSLTFEVGGEDTAFEWGANRTNASGTEYLYFNYSDPTDETSSLTLSIYERDNQSNALVTNQQFTGPIGSIQYSEQLAGDDADTSWVVEWSGQRGGESISGRIVVGQGKYPVNWSLDPMLQDLLVGLLIVFVGGFWSVDSGNIGAVVVSGLGAALWGMGWLQLPGEWVLATCAVAIMLRIAHTGGLTPRG